MSGQLVNAFGAISLEETQKNNEELLLLVLTELRVMNEHLARMRGEDLTVDDIDMEGLE